MTVYVMNYKGTIYGVYTSYTKAIEAAEAKFGVEATLYDVAITQKEVQ